MEENTERGAQDSLDDVIFKNDGGQKPAAQKLKNTDEWNKEGDKDKNHPGSDVEALVAMEPVVMMSMENLEDAKRLPVAKM